MVVVAVVLPEVPVMVTVDVPVMAEGVENEEQRGFLAGLGCHSFQGTRFSRPLPLEEFQAFIQGRAESSTPPRG